MAKVAKYKKDVVDNLVGLINKYDIIASVNMMNLPTKQLQTMRALLREKKVVLRMTKRRFMKIAIEKSEKKDQLQEFIPYLKGMPALLFTNENPFKIYALIQKNKSSAPAKAGQEAPKDIVVTAGPTSFSPGPIIGQLGKFRIKTGVENGKIAIKEDTVVAEQGEILSQELAGILTRLGIEPMEIGLNITGVFENGNIYTPEILAVDEKEYLAKIQTCAVQSMNLAVFASYPTKDTITTLLSKAYNDAKGLAQAQGIITKDTVGDIIRKAQAEMLALSQKLPKEALSEELQSQPQAETKKVEETSQEEEKKEKEEEQQPAAAGLGSLFG